MRGQMDDRVDAFEQRGVDIAGVDSPRVDLRGVITEDTAGEQVAVQTENVVAGPVRRGVRTVPM